MTGAGENRRMTTLLSLASPSSLGLSAERLARIDRFLAERYVDPGLCHARCCSSRDAASSCTGASSATHHSSGASGSPRTRSFGSTR